MAEWAGQELGWRFLARRTTGTGTPGPWLNNEVPLLDVAITRVLSGPQQLTGRIEPVHAQLVQADGLPLLTEHDTEIYAEKDGIIRYGGHVARAQASGSTYEVEGNGFSGYAKGMGYTGQVDFVEADPLDVYRHLWAHVQGGPRSNIGLVVDSQVRSPVRVGKAVVADTTGTATSQDEGPLRYAEWMTEDIGEEQDDLAGDTPFAYREHHGWNGNKTDIWHRLELGYPSLGRRIQHPFVVGDNVHVIPQVVRDGDYFANHVRVLGAGEGSAMIRAEARVDDGRLRRMVTITDDSIQDEHHARIRARDELAMRSKTTDVSQIAIRESGGLDLGAWDVGDEIRLQSDVGWLRVDAWFRIISQTINPDQPELAVLSLVRADRMAS